MKKVELELLTDIGINIVENGIWGGIYHAIHRYLEGNNKYVTDYDITKFEYFMYSHVDDLHGLAIYQKLPINSFDCICNTSKFD